MFKTFLTCQEERDDFHFDFEHELCESRQRNIRNVTHQGPVSGKSRNFAGDIDAFVYSIRTGFMLKK